MCPPARAAASAISSLSCRAAARKHSEEPTTAIGPAGWLYNVGAVAAAAAASAGSGDAAAAAVGKASLRRVPRGAPRWAPDRVLVRFKQGDAAAAAAAAAQARNPLPGLVLQRLAGEHHSLPVAPGTSGSTGGAATAAAARPATQLSADGVFVFSVTDSSSVPKKLAQLRANPRASAALPSRCRVGAGETALGLGCWGVALGMTAQGTGAAPSAGLVPQHQPDRRICCTSKLLPGCSRFQRSAGCAPLRVAGPAVLHPALNAACAAPNCSPGAVVASAEPDWFRYVSLAPNDALYPPTDSDQGLWHLQRVGMPTAWATTTGSKAVSRRGGAVALGRVCMSRRCHPCCCSCCDWGCSTRIRRGPAHGGTTEAQRCSACVHACMHACGTTVSLAANAGVRGCTVGEARALRPQLRPSHTPVVLCRHGCA